MSRLSGMFVSLCVASAVAVGAAHGQTPLLSYHPNGTLQFKSALSIEDQAIESRLNVETTGPMERKLALPKASSKSKPGEKAYVSLSGSIRNNQGVAMCALVLANGQYMFTCSPIGSYALTPPLDDYGQITLYGFAEGHFPFKAVLNGGGRYDITLNVVGGGGTPPPPPPPAYSTVTFNITDGCNDGYRIDFKFYDETNNLVWPSSTTNYYTDYYNVLYSQNLRCQTGANVCFGGRTGTLYWGVDLDNSKYCPDCCITCSEGASWTRRLTC